MASNVREIELALQVSTSNVEAIRNLQSDVAKLAKESGDAAPEFERLATELGKLAAEAADLQKLDKLATDLTKVTEAQQAAATRASDLTLRYNELKASTASAAAAQADVKTSLDAAKATVQGFADQIKLLNAEYPVAQRESKQYTDELVRLTQEHNAARAKVRELKDDLDQAKTATQAAGKAQNELSNEYRNANTHASALAAKITEQKAAYDELSRATLGVAGSQADLLGSQARLANEMNAVRASVAGLVAEENQAVQAAHALAAANADLAARAQAEAASYTSWWNNALNQREAAEKRLGSAIQQQTSEAQRAQQALKDAYATVGAQSVQVLENRIVQTRAAMETLRKSGDLTGAELKVAMAQGETAIAGLERQIRAANGQLTVMDKATNLWNQSMGGMKVSTMAGVAAMGMLYQKVLELGKEFLEANSRTEKFNLALSSIYGSSSTAAKQLDFLKASAQNAGVKIADMEQPFIRFSAATKSANIPLSQSNELFAAVTRAGGTLGLSADKVGAALDALGQMASKGVVSMEELRQQLGDALPGALSRAAQGLGLTDAELIKLVSSGKLMASDFFPALTRGLSDLQAKNDTMSASVANLSNTLNTLLTAVGDTGVWTAMKAGLDVATFALKVAGAAVVAFTEAVFVLPRMAADAVSALFGGGGLSGALDAVSAAAGQARARLELMTATLQGNQARIAEARLELDRYAGKSGESAAATDKVSAAHEGASKAIVQMGNALTDAAKTIEQEIEYKTRQGKVTEEMTKLQMGLTKETGNLAVALDAQVEAAKRELQSKEAELAAQEKKLKFLEEEAAAYAALLAQKDKVSEEEKKAQEERIRQIDLQKLTVDGIKMHIEASKNLVAEAQTERKMHEDNSGRLYELIGRYREATEAVELLKKAKEMGRPVDEQLNNALRDQRDAYKMVTDAANDSVTAEQAKLATLKASNAVTEASLQLQLNNAKSLESLANATGNTTLAIRAKVAQMEIEIKMSQAKAAMLKAEADAEEAIARAKLKALELSGKTDPVQKAELEGVTKISEAKRVQADAINKSNEVIQREISALNTGSGSLNNHAAAADRAAAAQDKFGRDTSSATAALEAQNTALERNIAAQEKANDLKERAAALDRKANNVDKNGFTLDRNGNTMQQYDNPAADKAMKATKRNADGTYDPVEYAKHLAYYQAQLDAEIANAGDNGKTSAAGGAALSTPTSTKPAASSSTSTSGVAKTYNVTFNGITVRTVSDADAQALMAMLKNAKLGS